MRARTIAGAWRELIAAELALDGIAPDGTALGGRRREVAEARVRRAEHEYRLAHSA